MMIDLGKTPEEESHVVVASPDTEKYYPTLYLDGVEIPCEVGEEYYCVCKMRCKSKTMSEDDDGKRVSIVLEVLGMKPDMDEDENQSEMERDFDRYMKKAKYEG